MTTIEPPADPAGTYALSAEERTRYNAADRAGEPFLGYRDADGTFRIYTIPARERTIWIGRQDDTDLPLHWDDRASRVHAGLRRTGQIVTLEDRRSTNGTHVNGNRILAEVPLQHKDTILIGATLFAFRSPREKHGEKTHLAPEQPAVARPDETDRAILVALCEPKLRHGPHTAPATNAQIAARVHLGEEAIRARLRHMFARYGFTREPQNQKRARLAELAIRNGWVSGQDL